MTNVVKKVGKMDMSRSQRPRVKMEEKKEVESEETLDQRRYLGGDLQTLALQAQQMILNQK